MDSDSSKVLVSEGELYFEAWLPISFSEDQPEYAAVLRAYKKHQTKNKSQHVPDGLYYFESVKCKKCNGTGQSAIIGGPIIPCPGCYSGRTERLIYDGPASTPTSEGTGAK